MLIRIVSPNHGTKRIEVKEIDQFSVVIEKTQEAFQLTAGTFCLTRDRKGLEDVRAGRGRTVQSCRIKHGDMLFLKPTRRVFGTDDTTIPKQEQPLPPVISEGSTVVSEVQQHVLEDEVDLELEKADGRIYRTKDKAYCRHGDSGRCVHCAPLEPYDESFLSSFDPPIKLLSFHAYIRKLKGGADKGKFVSLENLSCKIRPGCVGHPPWPEGICTKCQPNAVTLSRQTYRHVDYIQLENPALVDDFLNFWRKSGCQRLGFMYGRYERHEATPLGIKAVVSAIYEPPQESAKAKLQLLEDPHEGQVEAMAAALGLRRVGWIFTDLAAEDLRTGTVRHYRGTGDTHFLSAQEVITAAHFQNKYPNACRLSKEGVFGSKFVTVVVTGDKDKQIHFEGYQVSNQCMALVRDGCLVPTHNSPELAYVRESSSEQYIPDVFYTEKDSYGNEVTRLGRPLPVAFLLSDMPCAFPLEPQFSFPRSADADYVFPVENRDYHPELGGAQDFNALARYIRQFDSRPTPQRMLEAFSNFHLLLYLACDEMLHLNKGEHAPLRELLRAVADRDADAVYDWTKCEQWQMARDLMEHVAAESPRPTSSTFGTTRSGSFVGRHADPLPPIGVSPEDYLENRGESSAAVASSSWTCAHCTFENSEPGDTCGICALPRQ